MSMSNYASYADCVEDEFVKEQCPQEHKALLDILDKYEVDFDKFAYEVANGGDVRIELAMTVEIDQSDEPEKAANEIMDVYDKLLTVFNDKTDLDLYMSYHEAQDRGDEISGWSWSVEGVYQLSPAGKKYKDKITRKHWTVFG